MVGYGMIISYHDIIFHVLILKGRATLINSIPRLNLFKAGGIGGKRKTIVKSGRTSVRRPARRLAPAKKKSPLDLRRSEDNPIIEPKAVNWWESKATFNPGAFAVGSTVYLLYRAIGDTDSSVLGYARSEDGVAIDERLDEPAYARSLEKPSSRLGESLLLNYSSGGGWNGGAEDPRLTLVGDTVYLLYTAFDGWSSLRIALTSLPLADFKRKRWRWKEPIFISPPGELNKNWVLFPERIKGKHAILHSVSPKVAIEYVDSLDEFDGTKFIRSRHGAARRKSFWDNQMRGVGPPPLKTKEGWLVLYHAMDRRDPDRYKLGAMLLDIDDPEKIIARSRGPILEPDEMYENCGFKSGVVYACGAAIVEGTLFIYYGGADTVGCVATADLKAFLKELKRNGSPKAVPARAVK